MINNKFLIINYIFLIIDINKEMIIFKMEDNMTFLEIIKAN